MSDELTNLERAEVLLGVHLKPLTEVDAEVLGRGWTRGQRPHVYCYTVPGIASLAGLSVAAVTTSQNRYGLVVDDPRHASLANWIANRTTSDETVLELLNSTDPTSLWHLELLTMLSRRNLEEMMRRLVRAGEAKRLEPVPVDDEAECRGPRLVRV